MWPLVCGISLGAPAAFFARRKYNNHMFETRRHPTILFATENEIRRLCKKYPHQIDNINHQMPYDDKTSIPEHIAYDLVRDMRNECTKNTNEELVNRLFANILNTKPLGKKDWDFDVKMMNDIIMKNNGTLNDNEIRDIFQTILNNKDISDIISSVNNIQNPTIKNHIKSEIWSGNNKFFLLYLLHYSGSDILNDKKLVDNLLSRAKDQHTKSYHKDNLVTLTPYILSVNCKQHVSQSIKENKW